MFELAQSLAAVPLLHADPAVLRLAWGGEGRMAASWFLQT